MKQPKISLHVKLLFGYIISVSIIGIMVAILLYEQSRIKEIAANSVEINDIRQNVTAAPGDDGLAYHHSRYDSAFE